MYNFHVLCVGSSYCKELLEIANLADIERKIALYRAMFECNASGDRDPNFIKCESLMIELMAGGLSWAQQNYIIGQLEPNDWKEVFNAVFIFSLTFWSCPLSTKNGNKRPIRQALLNGGKLQKVFKSG